MPPVSALGRQVRTLALAASLLGATPALPALRLELTSPGNTLTAEILVLDTAHLGWSLRRADTRLILPSPLGISLGQTNLGRGVTLGSPEVSEIREVYPWRGAKREATNHCLAYRIPVHHADSGTDWILEARIFDDGFAYRYRVPGSGSRTIRGESSSWTLPPASLLWYQSNTANYEGAYQSASPETIPLTASADQGSQPVFLGPPTTAELPDGSLLLLTEANLIRYSGMTLRPTGTPQLKAAFEDDPEGFTLEGEVLTPWRVTVAVTNLQDLVNTDIIHNLADGPDPTLFPEGARAEWIRPGRALITWCVFGNNGAQWPLQKWFVDQCAALRCEYLLVDGGWRTERWGYLSDGADPWSRLKEICEYAAARGVGIIVWNAFPEGRDDGPGLTRPATRREFFRRCREAGVKGVKIDFFDSESHSTLEAYEDLARLAAENHLLINFHGANKPTGEARTWPNEITREGIREQEYLLWDQLPLEHYAALPFTRMVVGHSDFLPAYVRPEYLKNTTATFQLATSILATSSFHCWPDHPDFYLASPFLGVLQAMPLDWDSTLVLPGSRIGRQVGFARRAGNTWYVGLLNSTSQPISWELPLDFLGNDTFLGTLYRDAPPHPAGAAVEIRTHLTRRDTLQATLAPGGGFVAWIKPQSNPNP